MAIPTELLPVLQITVPLIAAILGAAWLQNKRLDDIRADIKDFKAEVHADFAAIRAELKTQGERLTRLEERIPPPLVHR